MVREFALFIFALSAVPLATFAWDFIWGILARKRGNAMVGLKSSWKRAMVAAVIMALSLLWLHNDSVNEDRMLTDRHNELINTMNQNTSQIIDRLDKLISTFEVNNAPK